MKYKSTLLNKYSLFHEIGINYKTNGGKQKTKNKLKIFIINIDCALEKGES
jgi:hypothetical protein